MDGFVVVDTPTWFGEEALAARTATLLNREGLVDAPLEEPAEATPRVEP